MVPIGIIPPALDGPDEELEAEPTVEDLVLWDGLDLSVGSSHHWQILWRGSTLCVGR
jgi:hypothetical protein